MDSLFAVTRFVFACSHHLVTSRLILYLCTQKDPAVAAGKEGAFKASVEWFINYLK